jgi:hypothetical protein
MAKISQAQRAKIDETVMANPERYVRSSLFRAMKRDIEMFGPAAFDKEE